MTLSFRNARFRGLIAELLIAVLALQALVPMGYMPGVARDGTPSLVLCSYGLPAGAPGTGHDRDAGGSPGALGACAFAAASAHLAPVSSPPPLRQPALVSIGPASPVPAWLVSEPPTRAHQPRGPPSLA